LIDFQHWTLPWSPKALKTTVKVYLRLVRSLTTGTSISVVHVYCTGQVASLTSSNNFINFCKTVNVPLTNGAQVADGSCNPAPMGVIPSTKNMPSSKFVFPLNGATIAPDTKFTIEMAIRNLETGNFVNAQQNYFAAPQQLNGQGIIRGHSHVVIELLTSLEQTTPTDPNVFAFFKGLNGQANGNGILAADVDKGLPAGVYKLSSINSAANHQPVLAPIAQHGSLDDTIYVRKMFTSALVQTNQQPLVYRESLIRGLDGFSA
jgi:hypothetical protein